MITLYTFGPYFGLPDPSPFVIKAMLLLKFAGLEYSEDRGGFSKAPKGKLPYINDDGLIVPDSTFIRFHIEKKYGFDFDAGLTPEQRAVAWAAEKMCEEHLHWALVASRWFLPKGRRISLMSYLFRSARWREPWSAGRSSKVSLFNDLPATAKPKSFCWPGTILKLWLSCSATNLAFSATSPARSTRRYSLMSRAYHRPFSKRRLSRPWSAKPI
jgi:glutathione S-transferase